ncbi:hypothetical protein AWC38_SpisGene23548 [Stylophora pistillata]|uniref:Uncharacterized protein n=1 Tax=Stylophora pistillata TaxID=50429 RepID=A0A2B4R4E9_STYPI|nr:hypothetical protein AWC38_SpisGene23548 [Stylophora pistillata]
MQSSSILSTSPVLIVDSAPQMGDNLKSKTSMGCVESQPVTTQHLSVQTTSLHSSVSDPDLQHLRHECSSKLYPGSASNIGTVSTSPLGRRPLPPPLPGHESMIVQSSLSTRLKSGSVDQQRRKKPLASQQKRTNNDDDQLNCSSSSSELEISYQHSSTSFNRQNSVDASSPSERGCYRSGSNGSLDNGEELDYNSDNGGNDSADKKFELVEMDLYILSEISPMYMHLKSTWNNCILPSDNLDVTTVSVFLQAKLKSTLHHGRRSSTPTSPSGSNKVDK